MELWNTVHFCGTFQAQWAKETLSWLRKAKAITYWWIFGVGVVEITSINTSPVNVWFYWHHILNSLAARCFGAILFWVTHRIVFHVNTETNKRTSGLSYFIRKRKSFPFICNQQYAKHNLVFPKIMNLSIVYFKVLDFFSSELNTYTQYTS